MAMDIDCTAIDLSLRLSSGGYDLKLFDKGYHLERYKCAICGKILRDAVQIPQSQSPKRACRKCYTENIRNGTCPIFKTHDTTYYPDKFADREILGLKAICINKENGCNWSNSLRNLEEHLKSCLYRKLLCHFCNSEVVVHNHEDICPGRPVECATCGVTTLRKNMEDHIRYCQAAHQVCECGETFSSPELPSKITEHWYHQTKCIYTYIGCGECTHTDIDKNKTLADKQHDAIVVSKVVELQQSLYHLKQENSEKDVENKLLHQKLVEVTEKNTMLTNSIDDMMIKMKSMNERMESMQIELENVKQNASQPQMPFVGGGVKMRKEFDDLKTKVRSLQEKETTINKSISDMDLKFQLQENKTMNGVLIWKIDKVDFRMAQAKNGKMVALHSAPCYSAQYEYKFCTRLYLNGDGMGRNTHISIFFVVMKSEYDDLLKWPMHKRITFELINHSNPAESIVESFVSNLNSSSFQRPTNNMNVAAGCPMFISIEKFMTGHFVRNNCAYIKTTVTNV